MDGWHGRGKFLMRAQKFDQRAMRKGVHFGRRGGCMARHAMGDRRDETLKQDREEYHFLVVVGKPVSIFALFG